MRPIAVLLLLTNLFVATQTRGQTDPEIVSLRVEELGDSAEIHILSSGEPDVVGAQFDRDGVLVLEVPRHRKAVDLASIAPETGLVSGVQIGVAGDSKTKSVRFLVRTRLPAMHAVAIEGRLVRISLWPAGRASAAPVPTRTSPDDEDLAGRLREIESRREVLEENLATARTQLERLRMDETSRTTERALRLEALGATVQDLRVQLRVVSDQKSAVETQVGDLEGERAALALELERIEAATAASDSREEALRGELAAAESQGAALAGRLTELESELTASRTAAETASARAAGLESRGTDLGSRIEEMQAEIRAAERARGQLTAQTEALSDERSTLASQVNTLESERSTLASDLELAQAEIDRYRSAGLVRGLTTASVNVRRGPGTQYERVTGLPIESVIEVLSRDTGWTRVRSGGIQGWIASEFVALEEDELASLRERLQGVESELSESRNHSESLSDRVSDLERDLAETSGSRSDLATQLATVSDEKSAVQTRVGDLEGERAALLSRVEMLEAAATETTAAGALRQEELSSELAAAESQGAALAGRLTELESELTASRLVAEAASGRAAALASRGTELETRIEKMQARIGAAERGRGELAEQLEGVSGERSMLASQVNTLESERATLASDLELAQAEIVRYRSGGLVRGLTTASVNVRRGPGTQHERVTGLPIESVIEILSRGAEWTRVRSGDIEGWIASEFVVLEEDEVASLRARLRGVDSALSESRTRGESLSSRVADLERELAETSRSRNDLAAQLTTMADEKSAVEARVSDLEGERAALSSQVEMLKTAAAELTAASTSRQEELSNKLAAAESQGAALADRQAELESELAASRTAAEATSARAAGLESRGTELGSRIEEMQAEIRAAERARGELTAQTETLSDERSTLASQVNTLESERSTLASDLEVAQAEIDRYRSAGLVRGLTTASVNVRRDPGTQHERVTGLPVDSVIEVMSRDAEWTRVRSGEIQGWIASEFVALEEDEVASLRERLRVVDSALSESRTRGESFSNRVAELEGELAEASGSRSDLATQLATMSDERSAVETHVGDLEGERAALLSQVEMLEAAAAETTAAGALRQEELSSELAAAESQGAALVGRLTELESELAASRTTAEAASGRAAELAAHGTEFTTRIEALEAEIQTAERARGELTTRLEGVSDERSMLASQVGTLESERATLASDLEGAQAEIDRYRSTGLVRGLTTASVNVRSGPGTQHERITGLPAESVVEMLSRDPDWTRVRSGETEGWIASEYVSLEEDELASLREHLQGVESELSESQYRGESLSGRVTDLEGERSELATQIGSLETVAAASDSREQELRLDLAAAESREGDMSSRLTMIESELSKSRSAAEAAESRGAELATQSAVLGTRIDALEAEIVDKENARRESEQQLAEVDNEKNELAEQLDRVSSERSELEDRLETVSSALESAREQSLASLQRVEELTRETANLQASDEQIISDSDRTTSIGKVDIERTDPAVLRQVVNSWAEAWSARNADRYLSFYARSFRTPGGIDRAEWEEVRKERVTRPSWISIKISRPQIQSLGSNRAIVTFVQEYLSDVYSDTVEKSLELVYENGAWKIQSEILAR